MQAKDMQIVPQNTPAETPAQHYLRIRKETITLIIDAMNETANKEILELGRQIVSNLASNEDDSEEAVYSIKQVEHRNTLYRRIVHRISTNLLLAPKTYG